MAASLQQAVSARLLTSSERLAYPSSAFPAADLSIHIHSVPSFSLEHTLSSHSLGVSHISFSNNSAFLASASDDRTVRVWHLARRPTPQTGSAGADTGEPREGAVRVLHGHLSAVFCVAWNPRDDLIASGGMDETVRVWDVQKGESQRVGGGAKVHDS